MRKLFILLTLTSTLFACDPHFDTYVEADDKKHCSREANGIKAQYLKCLEDKGYKNGKDPLWSGVNVLLKD